jgi:hypothetical protein
VSGPAGAGKGASPGELGAAGAGATGATAASSGEWGGGQEDFGGGVTTLTGIKGVRAKICGANPPDRIPTVIHGVGAKIYGADPHDLDMSAATYENAGAKEGGATMSCLGANDDGAEQRVYFFEMKLQRAYLCKKNPKRAKMQKSWPYARLRARSCKHLCRRGFM